MDLRGRFPGWLEPFRKPQDDSASVDAASPWKLTLWGRRFRLQLEIPVSDKAGDAEPVSASGQSGEEMPVSCDEAGADRPVPPQAPDDLQAPRAGLHTPPPREQTVPPEPPPQSTAASFWDVLDPTEREALRSVASWRTFAAGARLMEEGERADHVMVILGGRVKVCVDENGSERVLAVRGLGQLVGERGALKVSVRSATVVALDMIWALVVQTKDFAAFISAHPRVLAIVQSQLDRRGTEEPADSWTGTDPAGQPDQTHVAGNARRRSPPLNGENCTVVFTDVVEFGARMRTDRDRLLIREALFKMTQTAMQGMPDARSEDRGDGFLTVVPPDASTARVIDQLLKTLPASLELHNSTQRESARFKLRLAVNVGPVVSDMGVSGEAIIVAARLLEAPHFKEAVARSAAIMGVIVSPFVYETVIRHGVDAGDVAGYSQVPVEVKESDTTAWMKLLGAPVTSPLLPHPEPHLGLLTRL